MAKFTEIPWFVIKKYANEVITPNDPSEFNSAESGILWKSNSGLITTNTNPFQLYRKSEGSDFKEVKASITSDWQGDDELKLKRLFSVSITPSDDILRTVETSGYKRITYDAYSTEDYQYDIDNNDNIYVRKDSLFTKWLKNNGYDDFSNPEKLFLYLGKGFKDDKFIKINHYALKNWMIEALPPNNRNEKLNEFLYVLYDELYHRVYETQKNIFSLFDPYEISDENVSDISWIYNEEPLSTNLDTFKRRIYVDNLIYWLKKKGTYSSLFIIWYILTKESNNKLTIYDRWHTLLPSASEPLEYFEDYDHINFYTASSSADYPSEYSKDNLVLSPHYKIEFSIDNNPFSDYILSKELLTDLYGKWENTRPANKFAWYHIDACINTDFSGEYTALYTDPIYDANILSCATLFTEAVSGAAIHVQSSDSTLWTIQHNLDSREIITHVYDLNLNRIMPDNIRIINSSRIDISFPYETSGSVFIVKADYTRTQNFILNNWTINHLLNSKYVLSQFSDDTDQRDIIQVDKVTATDSDTLNVETIGLSGYGYIEKASYLHTQNSESDQWVINHNLGYIGVMVEVYDGNDEKIMPSTVTLDDVNYCTLTFSQPISGYCSVEPIGNPSLGGDIAAKFEGTWDIKLGNAEDTDNWDYILENDLKNAFYTLECSGSECFTQDLDGVRFQFSIPKEIEGYITEIGIFNNENDLSWVSRVDYLYKHEEFILDINYYAQYEDL